MSQAPNLLVTLTWLIQLESLRLSLMGLYSSSQLGHLEGSSMSTESKRSRLLGDKGETGLSPPIV